MSGVRLLFHALHTHTYTHTHTHTLTSFGMDDVDDDVDDRQLL